jgi:hypothetical protein
MTSFLCLEFGGDFLKICGPLTIAAYNCYVRGFYLQNLLTCVRLTDDQHGNLPVVLDLRVYLGLSRGDKPESYCLICNYSKSLPFVRVMYLKNPVNGETTMLEVDALWEEWG